MSNNKICYVRVPRTSSDSSFRNSKEWLDAAIQISGSKQNDTFNAAYRIANHLLRFYKDSVLDACETQKVPVCKAMTATQFQAMCTAGGVTGKGERELKKHLSAHLGKGFCPTRRSVDMLAKGHCEITYGCKEFKYDGKEIAEFVEWTEKNIHDEITAYLQKHLPANQSCRPISNEFKWSWVGTTVTPPFSSARLFLFISETTQNQSISSYPCVS
jgi:hypothetical protein